MDAAAPTFNSGDTAWMLVATVLVLSMTIPGLSLLYAGLVRAKNVLSVLMQCFAITSVVSVIWMLYGYSFAFDQAGQVAGTVNFASFLGGFHAAGLVGMRPEAAHPLAPSIPETVFCCFQLTFAIITPALIISSFVERVKFSAVMLFTALWVTVVYLPICHMTWGGPGSFLGGKGVLDMAGGCAVEINSGISGLIAALFVGRRLGYPQHPMLPHSVGLSVVGGGMLWVGWFGFNAGSAVMAGATAGQAMLTTHLAASVAATAWMAIEWIRFGKPSALGIVTGSLAGLVAITPACGFVSPLGAVVIALVATGFCYLACSWLKRKLGYDDSLDVFGVHGIAGLTGTILLGLFGSRAFGGTQAVAPSHQLWVQAQAVATTVAWAAVGTTLVCLAVKALTGFRVSETVEHAGTDLHQHGEVAYNFEDRP